MYDKSDIVIYKGEVVRLKDQLDMRDPATGILLTPGYHGEGCLGNGEYSGYECCCDACDFYLECFPEWDFDTDIQLKTLIRRIEVFNMKII